jgi:hypothetical protein
MSGEAQVPDDDGAVKEDARCMEIETDALRRAGHHSRDPLPSGDASLPLAPRELPRSNIIVQCMTMASACLAEH